MPVKRRKSKARKHQITPEAVAAFRANDYSRLQRALELPPWVLSPLWVDVDGPPEDYPEGDRWPDPRELRAALIEAMEAEDAG